MLEPSLYWVGAIAPHRLALAPRPRGGEWLPDEVAGWRRAGVDQVLCLLEIQEVRELDLDQEAALCEAAGIMFHGFAIADRGTPGSLHKLEPLLAELHGKLVDGKAVAVHCRAGIGRSGLVAGCLLHLLGIPYKDIFPMLGRARGVPVPDTAGQVEWLERFVAARRAGGA